MKRILFAVLLILSTIGWGQAQGICDSVVTITPIPDQCPNTGWVFLEASHPGGVFSGPYVSNGILFSEGAIPGNYQVTYTIEDPNCTIVVQEDFTINTVPQADAYAWGSIDCAAPAGSSSIDLWGEYTGNGFYYWNGPEGEVWDEQFITVDYGGTYYFHVFEPGFECEAIIPVEIPQFNDPPLQITGCSGCGFQLRLGIENPPPNIGHISWGNIEYNIGTGTFPDGCAAIPQSYPGQWQARTIDTLTGCVFTGNYNVPSSGDHVPSINAGTTIIFSCTDTATLLGAHNNTNWDFDILWTTEDGQLVGDEDLLTPKFIGPGTYYLNVTNPFLGCTVTDSVTVPPPTTLLNDTICQGESLFGYTETGTYLDTFPILDGCDSVRILDLLVYDSVAATVATIADNGDGNGAVVVNVFAGEGPFDFAWSTGASNTSAVLSGLAAGPYSVTITGSQGCDAVYDFEILLDSLNGGATAQLDGLVFFDENNNCVFDTGEIGLSGVNVLLQNEQTLIQGTDAAGLFAFPATADDYYLSAIPPSALWTTCFDSIPVDIPNDFDTLTVNYPLQALVNSPLLSVEVSAPSLRRCFDNIYTVSYENNGTATAIDAYVELTFDEDLNVLDASIPWSTVDGNTYTFNLGDIGVGQSASFTIVVQPDCQTTELWQTLCVDAHIFPDTIPDGLGPDWNGALISVAGECIDGELNFRIQNIGEGDMQMPLQYIVIEDAVLNATGSFNLTSGTEELVTIPGNGSTFWLKAEQENGAPVNPFPGFAIEGCVDNPDSTISYGFLNDFLFNDLGQATDTECRVVTGSYDPNQKQADPGGFLAANFIEPNTPLEYTIDFQNTGNDTAFTVVLVDTLSNLLDINSLEVLGSSHTYSYLLAADRRLIFTFNDILLPDSTTNWLGSQGFVKFRIDPVNDLPPGTVITNSADIYFDFNPPIYTNTVFHTIWEGSAFDILLSENRVASTGVDIRVFPNPVDENAWVELEGDFGKTIDFTLYDSMGRVIYQNTYSANRFEVQLPELVPGIYFFSLTNGQQLFGSGRLMKR